MKILIGEQTCGGLPCIWDAVIDGQPGYIKYRWGILSLKLRTDTCGLFQESELSEQIGDEYDGIIDLDDVVNWLENNSHNVTLQNESTLN